MDFEIKLIYIEMITYPFYLLAKIWSRYYYTNVHNKIGKHIAINLKLLYLLIPENR